jgi:transposase-like protein
MQKANEQIRQEAHTAGIPMWQIADTIGISEFTLARWLRKEIPVEKKQHILSAIKHLSLDAS